MNYEMKPSVLREIISRGAVGKMYVLGNFATERHVDFICASGLFDALWFDMEHFPIPVEKLAIFNMVARAYPVTTIARLSAVDYQVVQSVLETGVGGIMCAMVESAEQAADIVGWSKFNNPEPAEGEVTGLRGWNGGGIDACYGNIPADRYVSYQNREPLIICQIETEKGVDNAAEIVAVPGVDGIFFGPGDYAHRIGKLGQIKHPDVVAAMQKVADICRNRKRFWGTLGIGREHFRQVEQMGAQLICPGGDVKVMNYGLAELAKTFG
jgi:2-keto-3-deoxy-L-rhamnonate aldolase RhmA